MRTRIWQNQIKKAKLNAVINQDFLQWHHIRTLSVAVLCQGKNYQNTSLNVSWRTTEVLRQAGRQTWMYIWVLPFSAVLGWALLKADTEIGFEKRGFQKVPVGEWARETEKHKDSTKYALYNRLELCAKGTHSIFMGKPRNGEDHACFTVLHQKGKKARFTLPTPICYCLSHIPETVNSLAFLV